MYNRDESDEISIVIRLFCFSTLLTDFYEDGGTLKLKPDSTTVEKFPNMIKEGKPHRFGLPKNTLNLDGYSDHLPISTVISTKN